LLPKVLPDLIERPTYQLDIGLPLAFKQRPRMTKTGHAYMAPAYEKARASFREELRRQWGGRPMLGGPVGLFITAFGEARGDSDNLAGFMMDAAGPLKTRKEPGILWMDDRTTIIPLLLVHWQRTKAQDSRWVINILELSGYSM
jgi:hypothetical protein